MKNLFNYDGPLMEALTWIADMVILNLLCILCCLPVITAGASVAAAHKVTQNWIFQENQPVVRTFFRSFRQNFRQATVVWLITLAGVLLMALDFMLVTSYVEGAFANVMFALLVVVCAAAALILSYMYPLIVRYQNTLPGHLRNAAILALARIPRSALITALFAIPPVLYFFANEWFWRTFLFWILIGFSCLIFMNNYLLKPIFSILENPGEGES